MATTTFAIIRDQIIVKIKAITPTLLAGDKFDHVPKRYTVEEYVDSAGGSGTLRRFDLRRSGMVETLPHLGTSEIMREEFALLTVAYPKTLGRYGMNDRLDMDDVIRGDARQIRDTIMSTGNFVSGQSEAQVTIQEPERGDSTWFQSFLIRVLYLEAQSIT